MKRRRNSFQLSAISSQPENSGYQLSAVGSQPERTSPEREARGSSARPSPLAPRPSRSAFTLIELIVAVAILLGIMAMIGMVFQTAGKSSGKAQATAVVHRHLRQAVEQIRSDLGGMTPGSGLNAPVMAIAGVEVKAYATPEDKSTARPLAATDTHRADVLMLFTNRKTQPYIFRDPNYHDPAKAIKFGDTVQVVYGHADLGVLRNQSGTWQFGANQTRRVEGVPSKPGISEIAASEWHLARRLVSFPVSQILGPTYPTGMLPRNGSVFPAATLGDIKFLSGEADVYRDPVSWLWFDLLGNNDSLFGQGYHHYTAATVDQNYYILKGANNLLWFRYDTADATTAPWYLFNAPPASDYRWRFHKNLSVWENESPPVDTNAVGVPTTPGGYKLPDVRPWFYDTSEPDRRTLLDLSPPAGAPERMSAFFLPACTDFRVEYTYDDPREILIAPDTPAATNTFTAQPTLPIRWQTVPNGQQMVWSRLSVSSNMYAAGDAYGREYTDPLRWPRALRITLRVTGQGTSLEQPVEQTIIWSWDE